MGTRPRKSFRNSPHKRGPANHDPYLDVVYQQWPFIVALYRKYADKNPVMLFDIQEQRVYAYPYDAYRAELSERSQASLERQYECTRNEGQVVVVCQR